MELLVSILTFLAVLAVAAVIWLIAAAMINVSNYYEGRKYFALRFRRMPPCCNCDSFYNDEWGPAKCSSVKQDEVYGDREYVECRRNRCTRWCHFSMGGNNEL